MTAAVSNVGNINALTWAIFWRYGLVGLILTTAVGLGLYMISLYVVYVYYAGAVGLPQRELVNVHPLAGLAIFVLPTLGAFVINRLILKWVLRSLHGKNIGGMTFLLTNVSNDRDLANAN